MLSKSRYKLASECPRKLYYAADKDTYPNTKQQDEFLQALAEYGHQVGHLAQILHPGGILVDTLIQDDAVAQTTALLARDEVTIYEAAIRVPPYLIRIDVLQKQGNQLRLIEVKATSWKPTKGDLAFMNTKGAIDSHWIEYLEDVAFQTWVTRQALPGMSVTPFLSVIDTTFIAQEDGLYAQFRVERIDDRKVAVRIADPARAACLGEGVLTTVNAAAAVDLLLRGQAKIPAEGPDGAGATLPERAAYFAALLDSPKPVPDPPPVGAVCKHCEFNPGEDLLTPGSRSGFAQCWSACYPAEYRPGRAPAYALWRLQSKVVDELSAAGTRFIDQVRDADLKKVHVRQIRQLAAVQGAATAEVRDPELADAMASWSYPIHCLDFETIAPALPFFRGMRPYETVAFQFSCHHIHADGRVTHDDFLLAEPNRFPCWEFLRALRASLGDRGTILRYAPHENTVLRSLRRMLLDLRDGVRPLPPLPHDLSLADLVSWIEGITAPTGNEDGATGSRSMVDLMPLVVNHYYHPRMGGSNSIKYVLPAVMTASKALATRYQRPVGFGTHLSNEILWRADPATMLPMDPYDLLPPVFDDLTILRAEEDEQGLQNGGAAMVAFARIQACGESADRQEAYRRALLRYCELDTLAMLMIVQHWGGLTIR
jgi:hypothetical protein